MAKKLTTRQLYVES